MKGTEKFSVAYSVGYDSHWKSCHNPPIAFLIATFGRVCMCFLQKSTLLHTIIHYTEKERKKEAFS